MSLTPQVKQGKMWYYNEPTPQVKQGQMWYYNEPDSTSKIG